jgi:tetratricopeptide (TPR) repeat protein
MHASLRARLLPWLTAITVLHATAALAQPAAPRKLNENEKSQARALYDEGLRHYNVAEYTDAIAAFKGAYLISGDPKLLFNVGQSYRLSGDCEQALRFYKNFERAAPSATNLAEVDAAISKCEAAPAAPVAAPPPERPVVVERPAPAPPPVAPPAGFPAASPREGVPAAPVGVSQGAAGTDSGYGKRVAGVTLAALGVAAAGTGVVLGLSGRSQLRQLHAREGEWGPEEKRNEANAQRMETAGQIAIGVGATSLVAGVVVYLMGNAEHGRPSQVALAPGRHGGQVVWSCGF